MASAGVPLVCTAALSGDAKALSDALQTSLSPDVWLPTAVDTVSQPVPPRLEQSCSASRTMRAPCASGVHVQDGKNALHCAAYAGSWECASIVLAACPNLLQSASKKGSPPCSSPAPRAHSPPLPLRCQAPALVAASALRFFVSLWCCRLNGAALCIVQ
ncbi:hypothetical protein EON66_04770, partial [archaeon]